MHIICLHLRENLGMITFNLRKTYNFNILGDLSSLFNERYSLMKLVAIVDALEALKYDDVVSKHEAAYPLSPTLPKSYRDLTYLVFENYDRVKLTIAQEYIDAYSVTEVKSIDLSIKVRNISTEDITVIKNALIELGYPEIFLSTN